MFEHNGQSQRTREPDADKSRSWPGQARDNENGSSPRAWRIVAASIGALLLAIVIAGLVTIVENNRVNSITERALSFDIEVEDEASDVQVAVLELRHMHRNIVYGGSTAAAVADFDDAFRALQEEMSELEGLRLDQIGITQPRQIRDLAERYYADMRPAIDSAETDPRQFQTASDIGLTRLEDMGDAANQIDDLGDRLADDSLMRIREALRTEQILLTGLVIGVLLTGAVLALSSGRLLARLRVLYQSEQAGRRDLSRALQTKTDFIADASHELRTPLAVILGNAGTALASSDVSNHASSLEAIAEEARRMGKLVDDLLFLARSDAGAPPLETEYVPARWLVTRLVKPAEMLAQRHGACITSSIDGMGFLEVDPARIEQAILILIDNAARHSPPGACVTLEARVEGRAFAVIVSDRGSGIAPDELPLIFDRFFQVRNRRTRKRGASGLGLSIARTIVAAHGGHIVAESALGEGTQMTIRLPLAPPPVQDDEPVMASQRLVVRQPS